VTIADKLIRAKEDFDRVYEAGYEKGKTEGGDSEESYKEGFEAGKVAEHDAFWSVLQNGGERVLYSNAFYSMAWTKEIFKPKFSMHPTDMAGCFFQFNNNGEQVDFVELAEEQGIEFDFSNAENFTTAFATGGISRLGTVDLAKATGSANRTNSMFYGAYNQKQGLRRIERMICHPKNLFPSNVFQGCKFLEYVGFEGEIADSLNLQWSPKLSRESIASLVRCLSDDASGKTITLSKTAVEAFDSEITAIPFGLTTAQEGANVTGVDNGDGTATFNGTIGYDTVFVHGNATDVFSAGSYAISFHDANQFDFYVSLFDLDGNHIITYTAWNDAHDGVVTFTTDKDFVMKASLYAMGPYTFNNEVITYPTIRPDFETLKATKPNWTITLV
jgi:hypothetical protein